MKNNIVLQVVAGMGLVALSVTTAQAGGGAGGVSLAVNFECISISDSENLGETVSINQLGTSTVLHPTVRINNAVLSCRQVDVRDSGGNLITPALGDHLKCYGISTPGSQGSPQTLQFADEFVTETVRVGVPSQFLCTSAGVTIPVP